jgi:acetyl-CoA C-acetyltransferase
VGHKRSLEEILFDVTQESLVDAGFSIETIDGIVVAANDQYDGRAISIMAASGSVGGVDRDILSTPSSGEHAFVLGALRILTGQFRAQLVVAWSPTETLQLSEVQRLGADPYYHRALPLDEAASHALQATALCATVPRLPEVASMIATKNRRHGVIAYPGANRAPSDRVSYWPLVGGTLAAPCAGAVALVLASEDCIAERGIKQVAWVQGMGWATESSFLGDRDLSVAPALVAAAQQAYRQAGIESPLASFDIAEVADATAYQELLAYEGLGFATRDDWRRCVMDGSFAAEGKLPVNLSGGALTLNPVFCSGAIRIAEVANQIRGRAGPHQKRAVRRGVAHASSGFAMQYNTVVVLGSEEGAGA